MTMIPSVEGVNATTPDVPVVADCNPACATCNVPYDDGSGGLDFYVCHEEILTQAACESNRRQYQAPGYPAVWCNGSTVGLGPSTGNSRVVLTGLNFIDVPYLRCRFGDAGVTRGYFMTNTTMYCMSPRASPGGVDITRDEFFELEMSYNDQQYTKYMTKTWLRYLYYLPMLYSERAPNNAPVWARTGRLSALSVFLSASILYGAFCVARGAINMLRRRFPARAVQGRLRPRDLPRGRAAHGLVHAGRLRLHEGRHRRR